MSLRVSCVVLDLDGGAMLERALASIAAQTRRFDEVLVFDNGSSVPTRTAVAEVRVVRAGENAGFAGGANRAIELTTGELVALVNNDVVLDPQWNERLAAELETAPRIAAVQSVIRSPDGRIDGAGIDLSDGTIRQAGHGAATFDASGEPWGISATAALYRRDALREVAVGGGVFRESFFAYYEDVELSARLRAAGWGVRLVDEVLATHEGSATAGRLGARRTWLRTRNRYWFARLHPGAVRRSALLAEDCRLAIRAALRGDGSSVSGIVRGLVAGHVTKP